MGRSADSSRIALELLRTYHNISITEEEADSVWHFLKKGARSSALLNDLYSFHKELQDHARNGSTSNMRNTVAFLIQKHGTTEDEAFGLIKEDVLREEKELMDAYRMWQASRAYKSQDLQKYVVLAILYFGGLSYWQAISPRYKQQNDSSGNNGGLSMNKESLRCQQDYHPVHADSLKALPASHDGLESMGSISNTSGNDSLEGDAMNYLNEPLQKARAEEVRDKHTPVASSANQSRFAWALTSTLRLSLERTPSRGSRKGCNYGSTCPPRLWA